MTVEETLIAKLRRLSEVEQARLLNQVETWLTQMLTTQTADIQRAVAAVECTWATVTIGRESLHWIAESKELEYDIR